MPARPPRQWVSTVCRDGGLSPQIWTVMGDTKAIRPRLDHRMEQRSMRVSVRTNERAFRVGMATMGQRFHLAGAIAASYSATDVKAALVDGMQRSFDRPTPYVLN
eukprot:gene9194-12288_t